ncbi:MAG: recombination protein O N-terminal domain-containing protein [Terrimicrobiaceae bacterium]|nr:recombination protein O N-terminal domain-containing protein [Terrimicrobiaceae bacterium]
MERAHAILIRRIRFAETSLICVWLTRTHGKVKTSARGALRPGGAFAGKLDLFYEAEIAFARSRTGEVHALREVALLRPFDGEGRHYANLAAASYFADLVDQVTEPGGQAEEVFDLLRRAIGYLRSHRSAPRAIHHFEAELCRALGVGDTAARNDPIHILAAQCGRIPASRESALKACTPPLAKQPPGDKLR